MIYTTLNQILFGGNHHLTVNGNDTPQTISFKNARLIEKPNFMDFLWSGWKLNLKCAIDFTASNGDVIDPSSLHYVDPSRSSKNDYEYALLYVSSIMDQYSKD